MRYALCSGSCIGSFDGSRRCRRFAFSGRASLFQPSAAPETARRRRLPALKGGARITVHGGRGVRAVVFLLTREGGEAIDIPRKGMAIAIEQKLLYN